MFPRQNPSLVHLLCSAWSGKSLRSMDLHIGNYYQTRLCTWFSFLLTLWGKFSPRSPFFLEARQPIKNDFSHLMESLQLILTVCLDWLSWKEEFPGGRRRYLKRRFVEWDLQAHNSDWNPKLLFVCLFSIYYLYRRIRNYNTRPMAKTTSHDFVFLCNFSRLVQ